MKRFFVEVSFVILLIANFDFVFGENDLKFISRDEWKAQAPKHELSDLSLPVPNVVIAHSATTGCTTYDHCKAAVRNIQAFHMESRDFDDIAYNFLIGGDGAVYVGRDWDKQGAHTKGHKNESIGIAFIGAFVTFGPTEKQLRTTQLLLEEGVEQNILAVDYKLYGHRDLTATESPGEALYQIIKKWPHYFKNNKTSNNRL